MSSLSNYRDRMVGMIKNSSQSVVFSDTSPNHVIIQNYNANAVIYVAVQGVASEKYYDEKLNGIGKVMVSKDIPFQSINVFVNSTEDIQLRVESFYKDYIPQMSNNIIVSGGGGEGGTSDGIVRGFTTSLPSGNGHIGSVSISGTPTVLVEQKPLVEGNNKIGKVEVTNQHPLVQSEAHIGRVTVANGLTISQMPPISISGNIENSYNGYDFIHGEVSEEIVINPTMSFSRLQFISNDGENDLHLKINEGATIILKGKEVIGELNIMVRSLSISSVGTSYRIMGLI